MAIQPEWEMDERAKIFWICVWSSPIQPPAEGMAMVVNGVALSQLARE